MASLSITAANVAFVSGAIVREFNAGVTVTAGQTVYLTASLTWALARATTETLAGGTVSGTLPGRTGIALHASLAGQPLAVQESGRITIGATVTVGEVYCIATDAAGGIELKSALSSTNKINLLGMGLSTTVLDLTIHTAYQGGYTGIAVA